MGGSALDKHECIIVITNPMIAANKSIEVTLSKFLRVISGAHDSIRVMGGNICLEKDLTDIEVCSFPILRAGTKLKRVINLLALQLKMAYVLLKMGYKNQRVFFWIGDKMLLPYLVAKIKQCEINYFIYGNTAKEGNANFFARLSGFLIRWMATHAEYTCAESLSVFEEWKNLKIKKKRILHLYTDYIKMDTMQSREKVIGMLCRLTPGKHVIESIRAFNEFHQKNPQWRLEIIGSGIQEEECKTVISHLQAESYIIMRGWIDHERVFEYSSYWRYLLFPTDTEGMPNSVIEMMGRGIPPIASAVGGIKDIVVDGENGWIISETSVEGIKTAIDKVLQVSDYEVMATAAWRTVESGYSLHVACEHAKCELLS